MAHARADKASNALAERIEVRHDAGVARAVQALSPRAAGA
jgi:hypothetical protein